jgi:beta-lactamase class A
VAIVLERLARGELVSAAASQRMLDMLAAQQHNDRIPAALPLSVRVAHKTGELPGVRHDAAVVFAPSGAYVLVIMVQDAPAEAAARAAIVDISRSVYTALEPAGLPLYLGLPPRLARQVFATPDPQQRLPLPGDPRTETARLPEDVEAAADAGDIRVRAELVDDLRQMQRAANAAGSAFWIRAGYRQPTDAEASKALPTEWILPCPVEHPPLVGDRAVDANQAAAAEPRQSWLGTVVSVTDQREAAPSREDEGMTPTGTWLARHAAEYGFIPALAESAAGRSIGREAWAWRWVGRQMGARVAQFVGQSSYSVRALEQLGRAQAELGAMDPRTREPPLWGIQDNCWTIATSSGRGCPARWYFLPIPFS